MRTMYDALTARNILKKDARPAMVAGYIDRIKLAPWTAADWALFPNSLHVRIVKKASTNDGHVLDVEPGDATPEEAPGWAAMRRRSGFAHPTIYCNRSTWPKVKAAFAAQRVAPPLYWIATATGRAEIPDGAIAAQYLLDVAPGIDISVVADHWPGVDAPVSGGNSSPAQPAAEEDEMEPIQQAPSHDGQSRTIPWNGKAAVLNAITTDTPLFMAEPRCWGPGGGTGGGTPVAGTKLPQSGKDSEGRPIWRVDDNLPGQFLIPAGTTRIFVSSSSDSISYLWPVAS